MRTFEQLTTTRNEHLEKAEKLRAEGYALAQKKFDDLKAYYDSLYEQMVSSANKTFEQGKAIIEKHAANPPSVYISRAKARKLNNKDDPEYVAALKAAKAADKDLNVQEFFAQWQKDHPVKKVKATADTKSKKPAPIPSNIALEEEEEEEEKEETASVSLPPALTKEEQRAEMFGALGDLFDDEEEKEEEEDEEIDEEEMAAAIARSQSYYKKPAAPAPVTAPEPEQPAPVPEPIPEPPAIPSNTPAPNSLAALEEEEAELARLRAAARLPIISLASINNPRTTEEPVRHPTVLSTTKKPVRKVGFR